MGEVTKLRKRQHGKLTPLQALGCPGSWMPLLLVVLGAQGFGALALLPVAGSLYCGDYSAMADPVRGKNPPFAPLSPPVLELITPDGCASSSRSDTSSLIRNIQGAVAGGVSLVQLRDYKSDAKSKDEFAVRLVAATRGRALLVVNGEPDAARASGADGVHLPERMIDCLTGLRVAGEEWPSVVGCSVHSVAAAVKAAKLGADYVQVHTLQAASSPVSTAAAAAEENDFAALETWREKRGHATEPSTHQAAKHLIYHYV